MEHVLWDSSEGKSQRVPERSGLTADETICGATRLEQHPYGHTDKRSAETQTRIHAPSISRQVRSRFAPGLDRHRHR